MIPDGIFIADKYFTDPVGYCRDVLQYEPDTWQADDLIATVDNQRCAVASGHGVGKTRLVASKVHWFLATRPNPQVVVTANTQTQLITKTWRELAKINNQALNKEWFDWSASKFVLRSAPETWFASAIPWTEQRSEAFAGTHEEHVLYLFDEASAIPDSIWDVSEGAMTTLGAKWCVYGNPTRNTGRFAECFRKFKHRWHTMQVDSRTAKMADKGQIDNWIADYGEDSDFVRVRVRGLFPRAAHNQFIDSDSVDACNKYKAEGYQQSAVILGVDIARFGDDQNVVCVRQGRKVFPLIKWRGIDTMQTASRIVEIYNEHCPDALFVDGVGVGGGVVDRLKQLLPTHKVFEINAGSAPSDPAKYFNRRAEMWGRMRDALKSGVELPADLELPDELCAVEYGFTPKNQIQLEKKDDMKTRGLSSPDCADALSMTYAQDVIKERPKPTEERQNYFYEPDQWMAM